jgi:hypothetical protein
MRSLRFLAPAAALALVAFAAPGQRQQQQAATTRMVVYKSPTCGCCTKWVDVMRASGFTVQVHDQDDVSPIKRASGVPASAESCHTAQVGGYIVEGHVPVADIRRMLRERPQIVGIAAPGMPVGSPGMEVGERRDRYEVVSFTQNGRTAVFERH